MDNCVYLIGYMGSGKTTVGKIIAEKLGRDFLDMDEEIQQQMNYRIREVVNLFGEEAFRLWEQELMRRTIVNNEEEDRNRIIATGGGIVVRPDGIKLMQDAKNVVYLRGDLRMMFDRIKLSMFARPFAFPTVRDEEERFGHFCGRFEQRVERYEDAADLIVDVDGKTPEEIADEIIKGLELK